MRKLLLYVVCTLILNNVIQAQTTELSENDSLEHITDDNSIFPLPVVFYTPESGLFFGLSVLYNFYTERKKPIYPSQLLFAAGYTTKDQLLVYFPWQIHWNNNNFRTTGEISYYNYAYPFYGIGNTSDPDIYTTYRAKFPRARIQLQKQVKPSLFVGLRYRFENYNVISWDSTAFRQLDQENYSGSDHNRTSGIGPVVTFDTRDELYYPRDGQFFVSFLEWNNSITASTHNYTTLSVDYALYHSVFDKSVLAFNAFAVSEWGDVPFNRLAQLGGNRKLRGYFQGFFQDKNLILTQLEWRQELFWRIGMVAFGSAGQVAPKISDYGMNRWNLAGGAGLRVTFDRVKHINVRLDYAVGSNSSGLYISFNEAF